MIGNCQAAGIAQALELLVPGAQVEAVLVGSLGREFGRMDRLLRRLEPFDHVFSHFFPEGFVAGGNAHTLVERLPRARLFPTVVFPAFHPDLVYVGDLGSLRQSSLIPSPVGPSHSAIALCAYLEGLDVASTLRLYTDAVFERLGYYDLWGEGSEFLLRTARDVEFDLSVELTRWTRRGCFMHLINHPRMHVLGDIAGRLAREAGMAPLDVRVEDYLPDALVDAGVWPVHGAVAARYGIPASDLYRGESRPGRPPVLLDLGAFVAESFALYARHAPEALACARVAAWREDRAIRAVFAG